VIEINLLPVREARRKADLRQQGMQLVLVLILGGAAIGFADSRVNAQIETSSRRIVQMEADIKQFQPQLDQVAAFRKKKANLEKKIDVIDNLDRARQGPVRVMDELATHTPPKLVITGISTAGNRIEMQGASLDNELVAELLQALGASPYFDNVELDNTKMTDKGGLKVVKFKVHAVIKPPKKAEKPKQSAAAESQPVAKS
jgi:type IV pilus assembly protein PilN